MISVIIPTIQKNVKILEVLVNVLNKDSSVGEIILIDNSSKGFEENFLQKFDKIKLLVNDTNKYVNPVWNQGIEAAKYEYFALFNDDVIIPENFCSKIHSLLSENIGIVGMASESVLTLNPENLENLKCDADYNPIISLAANRNNCFGIIMFGHKSSYYKIPNDMLILCGDDYLMLKNNKNGKNNYKIANVQVYHLHSMSSSLPCFCDIKFKDVANMKKYFPDFNFELEGKDSFLEKIFSVQNSYGGKYKVLTILGLKFKFERKYKE